MEKDRAAVHTESVRGWEADCERAKVERSTWQAAVKKASEEGLSTPPLPGDAVEPNMPQRRRLLVQDSTPEKLAEILSGNPEGTLHHRDELAGWLTSFDRYSPGGREFWLEAFGGRPFVIDRKSSPEPISVPFNGVSVVGGIQPEKLADALFGRGKPDDGLVARFLWAWPDRPAYCRPRRPADMTVLSTVYSRLDDIDWGTDLAGNKVAVTIPLDPAAADAFEGFERHNREAGDDAGGLFKSFCGKLPGVVLRLSIVAELARWAYQGGEQPKSISADTVEAVADWVEEYAKPMALRVFGDASLPLVERHAALIARYILKHKLRRINARHLYSKVKLPGLRDADPVNEALSYLVDADWLRPDPSRRGETKGRSRSDFIINPVLEASDGQVA
jgi:putative DNA primase/helicase